MIVTIPQVRELINRRYLKLMREDFRDELIDGLKRLAKYSQYAWEVDSSIELIDTVRDFRFTETEVRKLARKGTISIPNVKYN